ncbi:MAG TPA: hypothetical protein VFN35_15155 [Ktedonobacteraceae bacterium]|nr:hypothetical protein [Ktedonobacteraceae bacterium]
MVNQPYPQEPRRTGYAPDADTVEQTANPAVVNNSGRSVNGDGASIESQRENYQDAGGHNVQSQVDVYEDKNVQRANMRAWITTIVYFLLGVLEVILGLRFVFRLLGANQGNDFITFLYNLSHVFVGPFNGIFNDQAIGSKSVFELSTLVAMLIYALVAWGLVSLVRVMLAPNYNGQQVARTWRRQR